MGKKIFVTYGNHKFYNSIERIRREAQSTGRFDEVRVYTDMDLSEAVRRHVLFSFSRGGGYWIWKPWIVLNEMKNMAEDDILVYSDAGSKIFNNKEWDKWFNIMSRKSALFFFYSEPMEKWSRRSVLDHFCSVKNLKDFYQIMGGLFIIKKKASYLIEEWYELMTTKPELVVDVDQNMMNLEYPNFIENRHDQSVLSGVVYSNLKDDGIKVLYQNCEILHPRGQAVFTARISDSHQGNPFAVFPLFLEIIRNLFVVPMRYAKFNYLKMLNY